MDFTPRPAFRAYNFIKNVACPSLSARAIEYGLAKDRLQWIGYDEADKARKKGHSSNQRNTDLRAVDGSANAGRSETDSAPAFGWASLWFGLCQASTLRGIGYDWGIKGQLIPQSFTPQNFIREYLFMVLRAHILLILAITACQIYFRSSESDFLRSLGVSGLPLQSIMSRICLGIVFGSAVWNFLDLAYACLALFAKLGTATLQKLPLLPEIFKPAPFNPRAWPPLLRNPLVSDNLADFWTYRWHSILRRAFVVTGYKPARYATQRLGSQVSTLFGVMGAFLASGILHESAIYFATIELPFDRSLASLRFFMLQGIGLVAEQIFSQATGRSVGGWLGRMWIVAMLAYPAGGLAHAWYVQSFVCRAQSEPSPGSKDRSRPDHSHAYANDMGESAEGILAIKLIH
ncbi:hypothetical protein EMMF5_000191 [Cystobasidiomycetes sp. EMM_F5]